MRTASSTTDAAGTPLWVGVRLTRDELVHPAVSTLIMGCIDHPAIRPDRLHVDITEDTVVDDTAMEVIAALRQLGVHLTVEHFGTGPSSLLRLRDYPAATIRLDRSFIEGLGRRRDDTMVVTAVSGLAADLGIELSADGVDEEFQATYLEGLGVATGRGRLFGSHLDAEQLTERAGAIMTLEDPTFAELGR